jgi:hypothetical protein
MKFKKRLFSSQPYTTYKFWLNKPWYKKQWIPDGDERDYTVKSWLYIQHADLYLKNHSLKFLHYPAFPNDLFKDKPGFINVNTCNDGFIVVDQADDNSHPGIKSNELTAENIFKYV